MNNYLVISATGPDKPGLINKFSKILLECGCNILNTRMTTLGCEFSLSLFLSGNWSTIAKLEALVPSIEKQLDLNIFIKRSNLPENNCKTMTYVVHVVTIDRPGIMNELAQFFTHQSINIEDVSAYTYNGFSNTRMVAMTMNINISVNVHIPSLREQFMNYCDALNLDAGMEPLRD